jgi:hypothetical protein
MALQSSGAISILDIANEFGGSTPHGLSEYYGAAPGIPTTGIIDISDFYGASASTSSSTATLTPDHDNSNAYHVRIGYGAQGKCDFYYPESVNGTHDDAFGALTNTSGLISGVVVTSIAGIETIGYGSGVSGSKILLVQAQGSASIYAFSSISFTGRKSSSSGNITRSVSTSAGDCQFSVPYLLNNDGVTNMVEWAWLLGTWSGYSYSSGTTNLNDIYDILEYEETVNGTVAISIT